MIDTFIRIRLTCDAKPCEFIGEYSGESAAILQLRAQDDGWKFGTVKGVPSVLCPEHAKDFLKTFDLY